MRLHRLQPRLLQLLLLAVPHPSSTASTGIPEFDPSTVQLPQSARIECVNDFKRYVSDMNNYFTNITADDDALSWGSTQCPRTGCNSYRWSLSSANPKTRTEHASVVEKTKGFIWREMFVIGLSNGRCVDEMIMVDGKPQQQPDATEHKQQQQAAAKGGGVGTRSRSRQAQGQQQGGSGWASAVHPAKSSAPSRSASLPHPIRIDIALPALQAISHLSRNPTAPR